MSLKAKKVLVTGADGFIGSHLTDRFISEGFSVSVFDNLDPQIHPARKKPSYLNKRAKFIFGDVTNKKNLFLLPSITPAVGPAASPFKTSAKNFVVFTTLFWPHEPTQSGTVDLAAHLAAEIFKIKNNNNKIYRFTAFS